MNCLNIQENMSSFYDGDRTETERQAFEAHLAECESCAREYSAFKLAVDSLGDLKPIEAPREILANIEERIGQLQRHEGFLARLFPSRTIAFVPQIVTLLLIILIGGLGYYSIDLFKRKERTRSSGRIIEMASLPRPSSTTPKKVGTSMLSAKRGIGKDEDIEVVPCPKSPAYMSEKIERLVRLSNAQVIGVEEGTNSNEVLIRVPQSAYLDFMRKLKEAIAEMQPSEPPKEPKPAFSPRPLGKTMHKLNVVPSPTPTASIPEVKLIKVVYR